MFSCLKGAAISPSLLSSCKSFDVAVLLAPQVEVALIATSLLLW